MNLPENLPTVYRRHLAAAVGDPAGLVDVWEPDGVLDFPYASSVGSPGRLIGVDVMIDYFRALSGWSNWSFRDATAREIGDEYLVEVHGSADKGDGGRYEQDYVVRFGVSERGRIAWMREFWDPTRF